MKATKRILAVIIGITTVFVCVSCVRTQTAAEKSEMSELPVRETSKVINLQKMQSAKKTSVTVDEVRNLLAESEKLYSEYDEIVLGRDDGKGEVIRTDADAAAAGDNVTAEKYYQYLSDVQAIFLYRLGQILELGNFASEGALGPDYILTKNSPIMFDVVYMNIDSSEGSPFEDNRYKLDYYFKESREYDILSYAFGLGPDGAKMIVSVWYKPKGTGNSAEVIFPSAEQSSVYSAMIAREAAGHGK